MPSRPAKRIEPAICDDLRAWCAAHPQDQYDVIEPARLILRPPPRSVQDAIPEGFEAYYRFETPPKALIKVHGARLVDENGLLVLPDGSFVGELIANGPEGRRLHLRQQRAYYTPLPRRVRFQPGLYFPLLAINWDNYYHWNHDVVMRLFHLIGRLPSETRFLVPAGLKPWQRQSLRLMGLDEQRLVPFGAEEVWKLETVYLSTPYHKSAIETAEPLMWYRETCLTSGQVVIGPRKRRLYISRRNASYNRNLNEDEVIACLAEYGFEVVLAEHLTFSEQVELFAQAEAVVGKGAGMLNIIFARPKAGVLEILCPGHHFFGYWTISLALGHNYQFVSGDLPPVPDPDLQMPDVILSIAKLRQSVEVMLAALAPALSDDWPP